MQEQKERQEMEQSANDFFGQMASHFGGVDDAFKNDGNSQH